MGSEAFEVTEQDIAEDHCYLFVRQAQGIQCHGKMDTKLIVRPATLVSKSHQKLTQTIMQKHKKEKRIKLVAVKMDPEREKREREHVMASTCCDSQCYAG